MKWDPVEVQSETPDLIEEFTLDLPDSLGLELSKYDNGDHYLELDNHKITIMRKDDIIKLAKQLLEIALDER